MVLTLGLLLATFLMRSLEVAIATTLKNCLVHHKSLKAILSKFS